MFELWIIFLAPASAVWFFFGKLIMIYFWSIVLALGIVGFVTKWILP